MDSPKGQPPARTRDFKARTGVDRSKAAKLFIDTYYKDLLGQQGDRAKRQEQLEKETQGLTLKEKRERELAHQQAETDLLRQRRHKLSVQDFDNIKVIGRGAFGEVRLVSQKAAPGEEQKFFAMKIMNKEFVIEKNQLAHARAERDAMVEHDDPGIVKLFYSFQDSNFLYFVMEYLPGGDLMNLLINKHTLAEDDCKFYLMEIICAVHNTHLRGYIHRDLKPDNILVAQNGHVKLTDFGLCTSGSESHLSSFYQTTTKSKLDEEDKPHRRLEKTLTTEEKQKTWNRMRREKSYSTVGTSNYMAPEILLEQGYDHYIDWWAVGIIMYECLCGYAPFSCEDPTDTCMLILDWQNSFEFPPPEECTLSPEAVDLIRRLVTGRKNRYGYNEIISHPWFKGFDPKTIYEQKAPWLPPIKSPTDTQNFDEFDDPNLKYFFGDDTSEKFKSPMRELDDKQLPFVGWTYRRFEQKSKPRVASIFPGPSEADGEDSQLGSARELDGSSKKRTPPKEKKNLTKKDK